MINTKDLWVGRIWKREGRNGKKIAPFEDKYRMFVRAKDEAGRFLLQSVETDEKYMCYPDTLLDVYNSELFVHAYETFHISYAFKDKELPSQLSKEEVLELEKEYNKRELGNSRKFGKHNN